MITVTETAANRIRNMAINNDAPDSGVRIMVVGGGCSGLTYDMDFETKSQEGDQVFENSGVKVFVDSMSYAYLEGTEIDFVESFSFSGFHFNNPNAQKSCGCGSSFTI